MEITSDVYEFVPRNATIELSGIKPDEIEKLRNKRVTIVLRNVWLGGCEYNYITPNYKETKLEFFGG